MWTPATLYYILHCAYGPRGMTPVTLFHCLYVLQCKQTNDDDNAKFHIPSALRDDTAKYTIQLANEFGEDEGDLNVTVIGQSQGCLSHTYISYSSLPLL